MQSRNLLVQLVLLSFVFVAAHAVAVPDTENTQSAEFVKFADMEAMEDAGDMEEAEEAEDAEEAETTGDVEDTEGIEDLETMGAGVNARAAENTESAEEKAKRRKALAAALRPEIPKLSSGKLGKQVKIVFRNTKGKRSRQCTTECTKYWMRKVVHLFQNDNIKLPNGCKCNCLASQKC